MPVFSLNSYDAVIIFSKHFKFKFTHRFIHWLVTAQKLIISVLTTEKIWFVFVQITAVKELRHTWILFNGHMVIMFHQKI